MSFAVVATSLSASRLLLVCIMPLILAIGVLVWYSSIYIYYNLLIQFKYFFVLVAL